MDVDMVTELTKPFGWKAKCFQGNSKMNTKSPFGYCNVFFHSHDTKSLFWDGWPVMTAASLEERTSEN